MRLIHDKERVQKYYNQICTWKSGNWEKYITSSKENLDFENGKQWTTEEIERNQEKGNYTITINMVEQIIEFITGMLCAEVPMFAAVPGGRNDEYSAALAMRILHHIQAKNDPEVLYLDWIHDGISANISYIWVYNRGTEIKWMLKDFDEVIVDPNSKHRLFDDARALWTKTLMTVEDAKAYYNFEESLGDLEVTDELRSAINLRPMASTDTEDKYDTVMDFATGKQLSSDGNYVVVYIGWRKFTVNVGGVYSDRIEEMHLVGPELMFSKMLPESVEHYPLIPFFAKNTKNPYKLGKGESMKEVQRFINKLHCIALKNAQNLQPKGVVDSDQLVDGSIENFNKKMQEPGAWVEVNPTGKPIGYVSGQPLPSGIMDLYANAKETLAYQTASAQMMKTQDTAKTAAQIETDQETSLDIFRSIFINLANSQKRLGKVSLEFAAAYMTEDDVVSITDGMEILDSVAINKKMKLDIDDPESVKAFRDSKKQEGLIDTEIDAIIAKAKDSKGYMKSIKNFVLNKVSMLKYDVKIVNDKFSQKYRKASEDVIRYLVEKGLLPPEELIKLLPVDNKEEIQSKVSTVQKLTQQVKDASSQLEKFAKELEAKSKENLKLQEDMYLLDAKHKADNFSKDGLRKTREITSNTKLKGKEILIKLREALGNNGADITEEDINAAVDFLIGDENGTVNE